MLVENKNHSFKIDMLILLGKNRYHIVILRAC